MLPEIVLFVTPAAPNAPSENSHYLNSPCTGVLADGTTSLFWSCVAD